MGLQLIARNDDFSSIGFGKLGPDTTITSGLQGLFALHRDSEYALTNFADGGTISPTIVGAPTISATGVTSTQTDFINFGFAPTGDRTLAAVFQVGVNNAHPFSSFSGGGEYFKCTSSSVSFESTTYTNWLSTTTDSSGAEMLAVSIQNRSNVNLYRPKTQTLLTRASTSNQDKAHNYRTGISASGTPASTAMLFAYWNRALTTAELDTFYLQMKDYLANESVAVI